MKKLILLIVMILNVSLLISNGYSQWMLQNTGSTTDFHSVKFINKNTGWICGTGVIAKTTNAGINWIQQIHPATNKRLDRLSAIDSNTVYCIGMFKTILKTTNGGDNWIAIQNGPYGTGDSYNSMFFLNNNTGWISGSGQKIWKTTNGGDSLIQIYIADWVNDIYFKDAMTGILCGDGGFLQRTTNGGYNWYTPNINLNYMGYTFHELATINNQYCWVIGRENAPVYRSTDFGMNWDSIGKVSGIFDIYSARFSNANTGWCGGGGTPGGRMFRTTNGGYNWTRMDNDNNPGYVDDIYFYNDSLGWATGSNGMVLYTTNGGLSYVNQISTVIPESFVLHQNYPNPFNNTTNIMIEIKERDFYKLEIYDVTGKKVDNLLEGIKTPGTYQINYNASKLSSGIYFYKLICSNYIQTKKFSLIK
ncbi:MAG: YCF48-related protein [Candidatus Kapaibacterium sp.]